MVTKRGAAFVFGRRGNTDGAENGDDGVIGHDDLSTVGVLVLGGNAIAGGQLRER
jgi:hypothetical protein